MPETRLSHWRNPEQRELYLSGLRLAVDEFRMSATRRLTVDLAADVAGTVARADEKERSLISQRTKEALAAAKRRGVKLGRNGARLARANKAKAKADVARLAPIVATVKASGITTVRAIAEELNRQKIASPRCGQWSKSTVAVLLSRLVA